MNRRIRRLTAAFGMAAVLLPLLSALGCGKKEETVGNPAAANQATPATQNAANANKDDDKGLMPGGGPSKK